MIVDCGEMLTQAFRGRNHDYCDSEFGRNANGGVNIESRHGAEYKRQPRDLFTILSNL